MKITPLVQWIKEKTQGQPIAEWQLARLNDTLELAENSPFYRKRLPDGPLTDLSQIAQLPLMSQQDILEQDNRLLCVHPGQIERIVSLTTSGSTNRCKRIYFTVEDQELTVDFFHRGMYTLVEPGQTMAVMMPCERVGGVGDLICRGISRIPVEPVPHGLVTNFAAALDMLVKSKAQTLVGIPLQILSLARYSEIRQVKPFVRKALVSADYVPDVMVRELQRIWDCEVYQHYGMTETGLGAAIDCQEHMGYHMREADLLFEIIDPLTGLVLPDGQYGEVVFTTLTRKGMPLLRYRTGDISAILPGPCACGGGRRLALIKGRWQEGIALPSGQVRMPDLDEALLALPQIMDFALEINAADKKEMRLKIVTFGQLPALIPDEVRAALASRRIVLPNLEIEICPAAEFVTLHRAKRLIKYV